MRKLISLAFVACLLGALASQEPLASDHEKPEAAGVSTEVKLETLLKETLKGVDGTEVIVSRVTIPPNTSLPKHWHPGEEFAYILQGSVVLWQDGKEDVVRSAGDVVKVPLKLVHTAITKEVGATILVFRIHEQGKPERVLID